MFTQRKWKAMPMLGSPLWGVKDDKGAVIVLGLTESIARLIAAAPKLLEALEIARDWFPALCNQEDCSVCEGRKKDRLKIQKAIDNAQ